MNLEMTGRFMTFGERFVSGVHDALTFGCPRKVRVQTEKNGGSGVSCNRSRQVPTRPFNSTQMGSVTAPLRRKNSMRRCAFLVLDCKALVECCALYANANSRLWKKCQP